MHIDLYSIFFSLYSIVIVYMRKYYTLVKNGKQEGDGAGNNKVPFLWSAYGSYQSVYAAFTHLLISNVSLVLLLPILHSAMVLTSESLPKWQKLESLFQNCNSGFQRLLLLDSLLILSDWLISTSAPLLSPTITNTDMYVYILMLN